MKESKSILLENEKIDFKNITLTVAIPTLNSEKSLNIAMKSILNQKNNKFNLFVMLLDSGSIDKTKEIFLSYSETLKLSFNDIGKCSIGEARNYAINNSKGDYIIFLDSDDALTNERLKEDYKIINKKNNIDYIYGDSIQMVNQKFKNSFYFKSKRIDNYQFLNMPFNLSSVTVNRNFLLKKNINFEIGINGRLGEDWKFVNELNFNSKKYHYQNNPRVIINVRNDSHTQNSIQYDLNLSKMTFLCSLFCRLKNKEHFIKKLFFSFQIQSSLLLSLKNILKYSQNRKPKVIFKYIFRILKTYKRISLSFIILNIFCIPYSIFLILFVHQKSIYSSYRKKISLEAFNSYLLYLI